MNFLVDMNLPPSWCQLLRDAGFGATHWSEVGRFDAPDAELFAWARARDHVVFTNDLDFGAILAATGSQKPSVFQLRSSDLDPARIGQQVIAALRMLESDLSAGALVSWDVARSRVRVLPLTPATTEG
jgi:predicted nuclease of predicted toxin-antitoxin system